MPKAIIPRNKPSGSPSSKRPATASLISRAATPVRDGKHTKIAQVLALIRRPDGASLQTLMNETGWQAHSVRGAIAGAIKKKLALSVTSERVDGARIYRVNTP